MTDLGEIYTESWIQGKADPARPHYKSAQVISETLVRDLKPESVLDLGCGACNFSNALNKKKCWVIAVDGSKYAEGMADEGVRFRHFDLSQRLELGRGFDLVLCVEVIEHIDAEYEKTVLLNIVSHVRKYAVVTAAKPGQGGLHHVNCKPKEYWIKKFSDAGLRRRVDLETRWQKEWKAAEVLSWYVDNLLVWERPAPKINSPEWWDGKAAGYILNGDFRNRPNEFETAARSLLSPVLDIGSAFGELVNYVPRGMIYVGVDISPRLVTAAQKRHPAYPFIRGDILRFGPQWKNVFETACAFQVLEHFSSVGPVLEKIKEIARSKLVFSVPRGLPSESAKRNDGHLIGWENENALAKEFGQFGKVAFWQGQENHICGVLSWGERS